jgi:hypothetical protein
MEMGDYLNAYKSSEIAANLAPENADIQASKEYVIKKAREKGYNFKKKIIEKPFFDKLKK